MQQTADAVFATKTHLWEIERGKSANPSAALLKRFASHFGVTIDYLIDPTRRELEPDEEAIILHRKYMALDEYDRKIVMKTIEMLKGRR